PKAELLDISGVSTVDLWAVGYTQDEFGNPVSYIAHGTVSAVCEPTPVPTPSPEPTPISCLTRPVLTAPKSGASLNNVAVILDWQNVKCAKWYRVLIRQDSPQGQVARRARIKNSRYLAVSLKSEQRYYWRVRACDNV